MKPEKLSTDIQNEEFPENAIILLDGTKLDCFPKENATKIENDDLKLDTTGVYLRIKKSSKQANINNETPQTVTEKDVLKEFFLLRAVDFLEQAERILGDSRMYLAPVPIQNGLAYTGTSGFNNPTLGIYIEWWLYCNEACQNKGKSPLLTYHLSGSPLSGRNSCACVDSEGQSFSIEHHSFSKIWGTFMNINTRYTKAKAIYQSYNLYEVADLLWPDDNATMKKLAALLAEVKFLRRQNMLLEQRIKTNGPNLELKNEMLYRTFVKLYQDQLKPLRQEYWTKKEEVKCRVAVVQDQIKALKTQAETDKSSPKYVQEMGALKAERKAIENELSLLEDELINSLPIVNEVTIEIFKNFLRNR